MNNDQINKTLINAKQLQKSNKLSAAKSIYLDILQNHPDHGETLHLLGILYNQLNQSEDAIKCLSKAMILNPSIPQVYHNLGIAYNSNNQPEKAIGCYQQVIRLYPRYYKAFHKLANSYSILGQLDNAKKNYEKALDLKPDDSQIWFDYGIFLQQQHQLRAAEKCYNNVVKYDPQNYLAYFALSSIYAEMENIESSLENVRKALKIKPDSQEIFAHICRIEDQLCDWEHYETRHKRLLEWNRQSIQKNGYSVTDPFSSLAFPWSAQDLAAIAKGEANNISAKIKPLKEKTHFQFEKSAKKVLRIGYLSGAFGNHPTSQLIYNLFALHQRPQFEIFAFATTPDDHSENRQHLKKTCDHFIELHNHSALEAAETIYHNKIDILVDLDGYIRSNRLDIAAMRPAPLQVNYLGFPGTLGADFFDYLIADETVIMPTTAPTYTEKIVYMPHSYQINNNQQKIAVKPLQRADYQLPENAIVYCCFNNAYKIDPSVFGIWMEILKHVHNSVFWLYTTHTIQESNLRKEAKLRGIDPQRLIFAKPENKEIHLARYRLADLFLDTLYYNAHTTASDALWAGLPILTCPHINFPSRVCASLLKAIDMPELITIDLDTYQNTAIHLGLNAEKLIQLKEKLQKNRLTKPLFDTPRFVRNLEKAYQQMWEQYISGQLQSIKIDESDNQSQ